MLTTSYLNRFLVTSLISLPLIVGFPAGTSAAENLDNGGTKQTLVNAGIDEANDRRIVVAFEQIGRLLQFLRDLRQIDLAIEAVSHLHGLVAASLVGFL